VTTIILTLCGVAEVFLLYDLAHFVQESAGQRRIRPLATISVIACKRNAHLLNSKAA